MSYPRFADPKDPEDIADYTIDFSTAMSDDDAIDEVDRVTLAPVAVGTDLPPAGTDLVLQSTLHSGQGVILWLAGGAAGWQYEVGVLVRTLDGRSIQRRMLLNVKLL